MFIVNEYGVSLPRGFPGEGSEAHEGFHEVVKGKGDSRYGEDVKRRGVRALVAALVCGVFVVVSSNVYVTSRSNAYVVGNISDLQTQGFDFIVVLGAKVEADGRPSRMLTHRLERAVELYEAGVAPRILVSGDESLDEVSVMHAWLIGRGVPESAMVDDPLGVSTSVSMARAAREYRARRVVVVTQSYHQARAVFVGRHVGMETWGVSAQGGNDGQVKRDAREWLARTKDALLSFFNGI